jgi:SAM-dependent methyltransferase
MPDYQLLARFYDAVMDDPGPRAVRVRGFIERFHPEAESLLELGCGTGSLLVRLPEVASLTGLDRSPEMLARAGQKVPRARLVEADMSSFSLGERFDVIACIFDSLNHLLDFTRWQAVFSLVHDHLAEDGLFVFDVNTVGELRRLGDEPPWVYDFEGNIAIMDVFFDDDGMTEWDVRVFENVGESQFLLHHERIGELGVPLARVRAALEPHFEILDEQDEDGLVPTDDSAKAHFACRPRSSHGRLERSSSNLAPNRGRGRP